MSDVLVSVVIPAHDAAAFIGETLESARAQTHANLEIIVVDDGSADATPSIVEAAAARDPRIRLMRQSQGGVAAARNRGIAAARGTFIAPLDADDVWHPRKIAEQVATFARSSHATAVVYCWVVGVDENGFVIPGGGLASHRGNVYPHLLASNFISCASMPLIRRTHLLEMGGYDPALRASDAQGAEDLKLYMALAARYEFAVADKVLVGYRQHRRNMSGNVRQMRRSLELVLDAARQAYPTLPRAPFRWAAGNNYYWMAQRCFRQRQYAQAGDLLLCALSADPLVLIRMRHLVALAGRTILDAVWPGAARRRNALARHYTEGLTAPPIVRPPGPMGRRRRKYLDALATEWPRHVDQSACVPSPADGSLEGAR